MREENDTLYPVVIDFGKCIKKTMAKKYVLSEEEKIEYKNHHRHIAPDLIAGKSVPSFASDIFSFGRIIRDVVKCTGKSYPARLSNLYKRCMHELDVNRPAIDAIADMLSDVIQLYAL